MSFHHPLGASSVERWLNCPASPHLSAMSAPTTNDAMERGTRIHAYAENPDAIPADADPEEVGYARRYRAALSAVLNESRWQYEVPVTSRHPMCGTTIDGIGWGSVNALYIVDLKTGTEPVSPIDNDQLILGAGAIANKQSRVSDQIHLGIYQELDDGTPPLRWWVTTADVILARYNALMLAADRAYTAPAVPVVGSWCERCRGKSNCAPFHASQATLIAVPTVATLADKVRVLSHKKAVTALIEQCDADVEVAVRSGSTVGKITRRKSPLKWKDGLVSVVTDPAWAVSKLMSPKQVIDALPDDADKVAALTERGPDIEWLTVPQVAPAIEAPKKKAVF